MAVVIAQDAAVLSAEQRCRSCCRRRRRTTENCRFTAPQSRPGDACRVLGCRQPVSEFIKIAKGLKEAASRI